MIVIIMLQNYAYILNYQKSAFMIYATVSRNVWAYLAPTANNEINEV